MLRVARMHVTGGRSGYVKGLKNAAVVSYFKNGTKYTDIHKANTKLFMRTFHAKISCEKNHVKKFM